MSMFTRFPRPTFGPRRDYSYRTEEPEITRTCRALGKEPQPWQRYVWAVGTEYRLDSWGRRVYHYRDVLITVPRQSGKTTLLHPLRVCRMILNDGAHLFSTAQTQKHSSKRMLDMLRVIESSKLSPLFKTRHGKGDAGATLIENYADIAQFTPNEEATHGESALYVDLDEIWFYSLELGNAIMGGIRPSQITFGARAQRWYTSTMGTLESEFMNEMVKRGRAQTDANLCYIEYSLPEGMDPYDPASWWMFHPALGNTITEESLRAEMSMPESEWLRAYCNRLTEVSETFMPLENWDDLAGPDRLIPDPADVCVAFEVSPGNENAAVVAGWYDDLDQPNVQVLHQAPRTAWLIDYLMELKNMGFTRFAADDGGPVRRVLDHLPEGFEVQRLTYSERYLADQTLLTAARDDATLVHDGSTPLRLAVASAQLRTRNGVELIDREKSLNPVPSLIAASVALYASRHPVASDPASLILA